MADKELTLKLNLQDHVSRSIDKVLDDLSDLNRAIGKTDTSFENAEKEQKTYDRTVDATDRTILKNITSHKRAADAVDALSEMTKRADEAFAAYERKMESAGTASSGFGKKVQEAGRDVKNSFDGIRKDMNDSAKFALGNLISDGFQAATQAAIQFGKESVDVALKYESTMSGVSKASNLEGEQLEMLSEQLRAVAKSIGPATAQDMADVAEAAARMGIGAQKIKEAEMAQELGDTAAAAQLFGQARTEIANFTETIGRANVGLQGFPGGAEAIATSISKILALYGSSSNYAEQYLSVINRLDDTMSATAPQIVGFLEGFTGANSMWKMSQEQAAAYGATLVSLGQDPHDAATRFQSALNGLTREGKAVDIAFKGIVQQSPELLKSLNQATGASLTASSSGDELQTAFKRWMDLDMDGALAAMSTALGTVDSATTRNSLSVGLYGAVGARAMNALAGSYADLIVGTEEAAQAFLDTENGVKALEEATGMTASKFKTSGEFIAAAFQEKPEAAISALIGTIQKIPNEAERVQVATELFGEKFGKAMADGAKNGQQQLKEALDTSAKDVDNYAKTGASSLDKEYDRALKTNEMKFQQFGGVVEDVQLKIGTDLVNALGKVISSDLTPLAEQFSTWLNTSKEAETLFKTTIPGAITLTVTAIKGLSGALSGINNMLVTAGTFWGEKIDAMMARSEKTQEALSKQFEAPTLSVNDDGTVNKQVAAAEQLCNTLQEAYNANAKLIEGSQPLQTFYAKVFTDATAAITDTNGVTTDLLDSVSSFKEELQAAEGNVSAFDAATQQTAQTGEKVVDVYFSAGDVLGTYAENGVAASNSISQLSDSSKTMLSVTDEQTMSVKEMVDSLVEMKNANDGANKTIIAGNNDLRKSYVDVQNQLTSAMNGTTVPTEALISSTGNLITQLKAAGIETAPLVTQLNALGKATMGADYAFEGGSLTPALRRYIEASLASNASTGQLSASMVTSMQSVLKADDAFTQLEATMASNKKEIGEIDKTINDLENDLSSASKEEKKGIQETIREWQNKRRTIQNQQIDLQQQKKAVEDAIDAEIEGIKESQKAAEEAAKAKAKAEEELQKASEKTADLRKKQTDDAMKAENEAYKERQQQAADSVKWIDQMSDASKKRVLGEGDAVKVLKAQGVELTTLQEQEIRRMQGAYKTEQAYAAQAKALAAQLDPMGALMEAGDQLSSGLGGLSSGIGNIGELFNIDTGGIQNAIGSLQQLAELPQTIAGIKDSISGIGEAFGKLKDFDLSKILSGGGGGLSGVLSSLGSIAGIGGLIAAAWGPLKDLFGGLFKNTKSQGTEAALAMQEFVRSGIDGGSELASAMGTAFDTMTASNFDFHASLQASGSTMSQVMGGISANWQQGSTAMDMFTVAVGRATGDMQKAPQVALQMMMGFDSMGLSAEQAGNKMLEVATKAGLSTTQIEQLKAALAAGGEEGASTTVVFDSASAAEDALSAKTVDLTGKVSSLTSTLSGAGSEGGDTAAIFRTASGAADDLSGQTSGLSGQVSGLANQLANTGGETLDVTNLFRVAGGSASNLSGNMNGLSNSAGNAGGDIDRLQAMLNALPTEKQVNIYVNTVETTTTTASSDDEEEELARGGFIGKRGRAIVNERGSEIAKFPGGGMALLTAPGPVLGAFPVGTEIIPHAKSMRILRDNPYLPRMASGGTITANAEKLAQPIIINYYQDTINLNASVIDRNTARMIDAELQRLAKQRSGV